jgi:hypothetical protein
VEDPGHNHITRNHNSNNRGSDGSGYNGKPGDHDNSPATLNSKTGISLENLPAKSAVSISVDANDAGEHLPLVYVLICKKIA